MRQGQALIELGAPPHTTPTRGSPDLEACLIPVAILAQIPPRLPTAWLYAGARKAGAGWFRSLASIVSTAEYPGHTFPVCLTDTARQTTAHDHISREIWAPAVPKTRSTSNGGYLEMRRAPAAVGDPAASRRTSADQAVRHSGTPLLRMTEGSEIGGCVGMQGIYSGKSRGHFPISFADAFVES